MLDSEYQEKTLKKLEKISNPFRRAVFLFCKENGICTLCHASPSLKDNNMCDSCRKRNIKYASKSRDKKNAINK